MHRKYYENAGEYCYYIKTGTHQSMDHGVWVPHFRAERKLLAYHNFSKDHMNPDVMFNADYSDHEPQNGDICPKCGREILIIEESN